MRGLFSEKSDVFSFGMLLLEIVSGRRNTSIYDEEQYLGLAGLVNLTNNIHNIRKFSQTLIKSYFIYLIYLFLTWSTFKKIEQFQFLSFTLVIFQAWKLWNDDNVMALLDLAIWDPRFQMDISKCIHVGLLCVQELAWHRPNVSTVISMLKSEILDLPTPKQPAFMERQIASNIELTQQGQIRFSICNATISTISGRWKEFFWDKFLLIWLIFSSGSESN